MFDELIPIFGILLVMIPVAGLTLGLTLRLAVKPFVETLARALRESKAPDPLMQGEIDDLRERLLGIETALGRIEERQRFDRALAAPEAEPETRETG